MSNIARLMRMAAAGVPKGEPWLADLANASYDGVSFSVAGQETSPYGLFFKPDGLKMYVIGFAGDDVNEYNLSIAWDVSTAAYLQNFRVGSQDTVPLGLFFRPDGLKMYVVGGAGADINEYNLSTAWDVSTASYLQNFSLAAQDTSLRNMSFKPDGSKMYVVGNAGADVNEYDLGTAWDISTASFVQNFSVAAQDTSPRGVFFEPNGTKMYVTGEVNDAVFQYSLSTAFELSTAAYEDISFSVVSESTAPVSIFFKFDGSKMYILDLTTDAIYQYSTA